MVVEAMFFVRALAASSTCASRWSSTSDGDKVAPGLTLPDLASNYEDSGCSLESNSLVGLGVHDNTASGCEPHTLVSVKEFAHRHQWTTQVCDGIGRMNKMFFLSTAPALCDGHGTRECVLWQSEESTVVHVSRDSVSRT